MRPAAESGAAREIRKRHARVPPQQKALEHDYSDRTIAVGGNPGPDPALLRPGGRLQVTAYRLFSGYSGATSVLSLSSLTILSNSSALCWLLVRTSRAAGPVVRPSCWVISLV